jgi:hypothetical protein
VDDVVELLVVELEVEVLEVDDSVLEVDVEVLEVDDSVLDVDVVEVVVVVLVVGLRRSSSPQSPAVRSTNAKTIPKNLTDRISPPSLQYVSPKRPTPR